MDFDLIELTIRNQQYSLRRYKETKNPKYLEDAEFYRECVELFKKTEPEYQALKAKHDALWEGVDNSLAKQKTVVQ